jgi:transposase
MEPIPKQAYMAEFKQLAVRRMKDGQTIPSVAKELGLNDQTLCNWIKAAAAGKLGFERIEVNLSGSIRPSATDH